MRAVIVTGKLVQDHEYIYPYYRLSESGYEISVAVPGGEEVFGNIGTKVLTSMDTKDLRIHDFDLLVLPGGAKCMEYLRQDLQVIEFIKQFNETGKTIAAICHAAQLLISAKIVKGRKVAGYYSLKDDIVNAGATYLDEPCVIDGNLFTTAHYKDMGPWLGKAIEANLRNANAHVT